MKTRHTGALTRQVIVSLTRADLDMVSDRLSPSTRQELHRTATEQEPGTYNVTLTETRARDLASKASNLGLMALAVKIQQELDALPVVTIEEPA